MKCKLHVSGIFTLLEIIFSPTNNASFDHLSKCWCYMMYGVLFFKFLFCCVSDLVNFHVIFLEFTSYIVRRK